MATSWIDDINLTQLPYLNKEGVITFRRMMPLFEYLYDEAKSIPDQGLSYKEPLLYRSAGSSTGLYSGDEVLNIVRHNVVKNINVDTHRVMLQSGSITGKELAKVKGMAANLVGIQFTKKYPELMTKDYMQARHKYALMGSVPSGSSVKLADLQGFMTLNGEISVTERITGVSNGLIDFVAPASQTDTVQSLAKSTTYNYVNQYAHSSGFTGDSYSQLNALVMLCKARDVESFGIPTRLFMDTGSFGKAKEYIRNRATIYKEAGGKGVSDETSISGASMFFPFFEGCELAYTEDIDVTAFSTNAQYGLTYIINPNTLKRIECEKGKWGPMVQSDARQEVWFSTFVEQEQHFINNLQANGALTGTNL